MKRLELKQLFSSPESYTDQDITVCGWVRTLRSSKAIGFIELNDGSAFDSVQIVIEEDKLENFKEVTSINVGAALCITGTLILTPDAKQPFEINASKVNIEGASTPDFPLQKKRHSMEFLREIAHLRPRTNTFNAVFRVRAVAAQAIHRFFSEKGFLWIHTPIITGSDAEGAGEMFRVTTLDSENPPRDEDGNIDYSKDFFGKETHLTVSGQLAGEAFAHAYGNIYTFGPTFRAENSHTPRHAAEFWMMEPEMAFCDLDGCMDNIEDMLKYVVADILEKCPQEMQFFNRFYDKTLIERMESLVATDFKRITYTEAIEHLLPVKDKFNYDVYWGVDLATEHERYISEEVYKMPVFVTDYPKEIKAFYMRLNEDNKTVKAVDLLVPGVGELVGGSQREERYDNLVARMKELDLDTDSYDWYLDLRKYGSTVHSGYGLGFERLIMYVTAVSNIRDVIPFPRTAGSADF